MYVSSVLGVSKVQVFYIYVAKVDQDVTKVDRDVAHVAMTKIHMLQVYVSSVLGVLDICYKCFLWIF
jgi:hypothetical protein